MHNSTDILALAYKHTPMQGQMVQLQERVQQIPGSVQYTINRYRRNPQWNIEDTGMMVYHYQKVKQTKTISNSGFASVEMSIAGKKKRNVICASLVLQKVAWKEWTVWM